MHSEVFGSVWGCLGVSRPQYVVRHQIWSDHQFGPPPPMRPRHPQTPPNTLKHLGMHCTTFRDALWCVWGVMVVNNGHEMVQMGHMGQSTQSQNWPKIRLWAPWVAPWGGHPGPKTLRFWTVHIQGSSMVPLESKVRLWALW